MPVQWRATAVRRWTWSALCHKQTFTPLVGEAREALPDGGGSDPRNDRGRQFGPDDVARSGQDLDRHRWGTRTGSTGQAGRRRGRPALRRSGKAAPLFPALI